MTQSLVDLELYFILDIDFILYICFILVKEEVFIIKIIEGGRGMAKRIGALSICIVLAVFVIGCAPKLSSVHPKKDPSVDIEAESGGGVVSKVKDDQVSLKTLSFRSSEESVEDKPKKEPFLLDFYEIKPGDTLYGLFGQDWEVVARFNRVSPKALMPGMRLLIPSDLGKARQEYCPLPKKLEQNVRLLIDLDEQAIGVYGDRELLEWYPISSGKQWYRTPVGSFVVLQKEKDYYSRTYPEPNGGAPMPYAMRFYRGYWIHGGQLPGKPASHGCIRLMEEDAKELFKKISLGDKLLIRMD